MFVSQSTTHNGVIDLLSDDDSTDNSDDGHLNQSGQEHDKDDAYQLKLFVRRCSAFRSWPSKLKRLCEGHLQRETYSYDSVIGRQGGPVRGLVFISRGQCKMTVDPVQHEQQYPKYYEGTEQISPYQSAKTGQVPQQEQVKVRRRSGYAAAERRLASKAVTVCNIGQYDIIGDIEFICGLDTYIHTVTCTATTEVYILEVRNIDKLFNKRQPSTLESLKKIVENKLGARASRGDMSVTLYKHLLEKTDDLRPRAHAVGTADDADGSKTRTVADDVTDRGLMINQLSKMFIRDKTPFLEPSVPGSIYYLTKSSERAERRAHLRSVQGQKRGTGLRSGEVRLQRARKRAQRHARSRRELERLTLGTDTGDIKKITSDDHAVNRYLNQAGGFRNNVTSPVNGDARSEVDHRRPSHTPSEAPYDDAAAGEIVAKMGHKQQESNAHRAKVICSLIEKKSRQNPVKLPYDPRPKSAPAPGFGFRRDEEEEEEEVSFDWETSDQALRTLEAKIRAFHSRHERSERGSKLTSPVSEMKRFSIQGPENVPIPGGTVYVKQHTCAYKSVDNAQHHDHIRRFMIPRTAYKMSVRSMQALQQGELQQQQQPAQTRNSQLKTRTQSAPAQRKKSAISFKY